VCLDSCLKFGDNSRSKFVIETHSDYLVDRVRTEVRKKNYIKTADVALLYFEPGAKGTRIHELAIDDEGNITNTPAGYRRFFSDEARAVLGF